MSRIRAQKRARDKKQRPSGKRSNMPLESTIRMAHREVTIRVGFPDRAQLDRIKEAARELRPAETASLFIAKAALERANQPRKRAA